MQAYQANGNAALGQYDDRGEALLVAEEFRALPREPVTVDLHCVTTWSKFDTRWEGVAVDTLLREGEAFVAAFFHVAPVEPNGAEPSIRQRD